MQTLVPSTRCRYRQIATELAAGTIHAWSHVGDFIYELGVGGYLTGLDPASPWVATMRGGSYNSSQTVPPAELYWYSDYAQRYAHYLSDPDLRLLRRNGVSIGQTIDDHEVVNNFYNSGSDDHDATINRFATRQDNAIKAWSDFMPLRDNSVGRRSYRINDNIMWVVMDTRSEAEREITFQDLFDLHVPGIWFDGDPNTDTNFRFPMPIGLPGATAATNADFGLLIAARRAMNERIRARRVASDEQMQWVRDEISGTNATQIFVTISAPAIGERTMFGSITLQSNSFFMGALANLARLPATTTGAAIWEGAAGFYAQVLFGAQYGLLESDNPGSTSQIEGLIADFCDDSSKTFTIMCVWR